jgi:hypothetical protein
MFFLMSQKLQQANIQMSEGLDLSTTKSYQHAAKTFVNIRRFFLPIYHKSELCAWGQLNNYVKKINLLFTFSYVNFVS